MQCNALPDEDKIDVLYGEAAPAVARRVSEHVAACPACRDEIAALGQVRQRLSTWTPPASSAPARGAGRVLPVALPLAAAVILALAGALALRGSELRYENDRWSFRLGPGNDAAVRRLLAEQDERHAREIQALRIALAASTPADAAPQSSATPRLVDVERLIRESEARQGRQLQARLVDLRERSDTQRRLDMARVSAGLSYLDGKSGQHVARTSELMNYMLQASHQR